MNVGEQLVSSYLRHLKGCEFIQTNLYTVESQGEIDVVGINLKERKVYVCEVAIHLTTGLQYVKDKRPNNVAKLVEKFTRDIAYARKFLAEYNHEFMLWSPIVRDTKGSAIYNQVGHLAEIQAQLLVSTGVELTCVVNEDFYQALKDMRAYAGRKTEELKCPLMRLLQIEELLGRHVSKRAAGLSKTRAQVLGELLEGPAIGTN
jgi:Holliday junction resolvase-like predicted endonuclease